MNNVNALIQYSEILISGRITQRKLSLQIQGKTTRHFRTGEYVIVHQILFETNIWFVFTLFKIDNLFF